jgi:hypothetical protein
VWEHISQVEQRTEERLATLCLTSLCGGRVKCGVACLNHLHALPEKQRYGNDSKERNVYRGKPRVYPTVHQQIQMSFYAYLIPVDSTLKATEYTE